MRQNSYGTIEPYEGKTFVAYLDISGFKNLMRRGKAKNALNKFCSTIFNVGKLFRRPQDHQFLVMNAIAVSDCAVLFPRIDDSRSPRSQQRDRIRGLRSILEFVRRVNSILIAPKDGPQMMTTCSIDYGKFKYEDRMRASNIREVFFVGQPYVNAFLDNEFEEPKILPGQCRLLRGNMDPIEDSRNQAPFSLLVPESKKYYYYYWMVHSPDNIKRFKKEFDYVCQDVYRGLKKLIFEHVNGAQT